MGADLQAGTNRRRRSRPAARGGAEATLNPEEPYAAGGALEIVEDLLARGLRVRVRATGASMSPWLQSGAVVTLSAVDPASLRTGDIVLARLPDGARVLHRLIGRRNGPGGRRGYLLKGDALLLPDGLVEGHELAGKVVLVCRGGSEEIDVGTPARRVAGIALAVASRSVPRLFARLSHLLARRRPRRCP